MRDPRVDPKDGDVILVGGLYGGLFIEVLPHDPRMGATDVEDRFRCISMVAERLERDDPYGAQHDAMKFIDLIGSYRLMAVLLTSEPAEAEHKRKRKEKRKAARE